MMKKTWQAHNLEGKGLQSINLLFASRRKDIRKAYFLAAAFPFGAHQFYLGKNKSGLTYIFLTTLLLIFANFSIFTSAVFGFIEVMLLIRDVTRMETAVADYNKNLKLQLSLQQTHVPDDYKGRYGDEESLAENTRQKILSFAEQEALLKEMSLRKKVEKQKTEQ